MSKVQVNLDLDLQFKGEKYFVKDDDVMSLIDTVERVCSHSDVAGQIMNQITKGYTAALNFAGCDASHREVHCEILRDAGETGQRISTVFMIMFDLLVMPDNLKAMHTKPEKKALKDNKKTVTAKAK